MPRCEAVSGCRSEPEIQELSSGHLVDIYLSRTENWLYRRLAGLRRYRPIVFASHAANAVEFPLREIHCFDRLPIWRRLLSLLSSWPPKPAWRGAGHFWRIMTESPCRVLHSHFAWMAKRYRDLRRKARERLGCATLTSFYGNDLRALSGPDPKWTERLFEEESGFVVEGPKLGERLAAAGCPAEKIHLNALGLDLALFPEREIYDFSPPLRVLAVGRLVEKKGFADAIRAVALARRAGGPVELTVAGDGPLRPELEGVLKSEGAGGFVRLAGRVGYGELLELYYGHQVLLQPSVTAANGDTEGGAPVSLLEGMAAGLAVVSTRHADIPSMAVEGETALLAEERRPEQLAEALGLLAREPRLAERLARGGRKRAVERFDANRQAAELEEIYDRVAGGLRRCQASIAGGRYSSQVLAAGRPACRASGARST
ncbi:MAG: glycosyltransferase [Planctomycetes bacterium]|nr:glycosyltransferase [Planctomycetota bacterium]